MEVNESNMFILNLRFRNRLPAGTPPQPLYNRPGQGGINIYGNNNTVNVFTGGQPRFAYDGFVGQPVVYAPMYAPMAQYGYGGYGAQYGYGNPYGYGGGQYPAYINPTPMQVALSYFPTNANGVPRLNWVDPRNGNPLLNPWEAQAFGPLIRGLFPGRDV